MKRRVSLLFLFVGAIFLLWKSAPGANNTPLSAWQRAKHFIAFVAGRDISISEKQEYALAEVLPILKQVSQDPTKRGEFWFYVNLPKHEAKKVTWAEGTELIHKGKVRRITITHVDGVLLESFNGADRWRMGMQDTPPFKDYKKDDLIKITQEVDPKGVFIRCAEQ